MAYFLGTIGNDNLIGTLGSDIFFGDWGEDILDGLGGGDEFVFNDIFDIIYFPTIGSLDIFDLGVYSNDGYDVIKNFKSGVDIITNIPPTPYRGEYVDIPWDVPNN